MEKRFPLDNLIPEILTEANLRESYDYVIGHLECREQRAKYAPDREPRQRSDFSDAEGYAAYLAKQEKAAAVRESILATLREEIGRGTFRIERKDVRDIHVTDGVKERECQAPRMIKRIGCHCIMVVLEQYLHSVLIHNTAASIKGRGMHWLHNILCEDCKAEPELTAYYYQSDIEHFYDNIDQGRMKEILRRYVSDEVLLPILDSFIELLPRGLSKGLRSSQSFANLYFHDIDRTMERASVKYTDKEGNERRLYYRYCDDVVLLGRDKRELWRLRDLYVGECAKIGLRVKESEAVRPLTEGLDFLGYVHYGTHSLLRKRIKQKAARRLARVTSRKRRQEIIGAFKGMACHGDCKHLYYQLIHKRMKKFSEMGVMYSPEDGKKRFQGKTARLANVQNKEIEIHDYETGVKTSQGDGRYLVSFRDVRSGEWGKFFTASEEMKNILDQISDMEDGFPFVTVITSEMFDGNKTKYKFT